LSPEVAGKVVAIDGKTLRGSHDGGQLPIHLVSAFASEAGIVWFASLQTGFGSGLKSARRIVTTPEL